MILPLVVLRRLDCVLDSTKDAVLAAYERHRTRLTEEEHLAPLLLKAADAPFYNLSPFTLPRLLADADNLAPNLRSYLTSAASRPRHATPSTRSASRPRSHAWTGPGCCTW